MSALLRRCFFLVVAFALSGVFQSPAALAGTTGSIVGTVTDGKNQQPLAGVRVEASSPSQNASTVTDAGGRFTFISLGPDTYALTLSKNAYERLVVGGITVQADQQLSQQLTLQPSLQQIGHVTARSPLDLVKPGTTTDVYSVGPAVTAAAAPLGGGGSLNQAYSAIASVPGVFVPPGQQGVNQSVFIRGGYYDQIGYEYDGVPMNRSFDNYPGYSASTLGQQELQVYAGGAGAGAGATGLAGFINQIVRTGTYPGFTTLAGSIGAPTFDHDLAFETGGATPSRSFSYYVAALGANQGYRYFDNANGAGLTALYPNAIGPSNQTTNLHYYPAIYPSCNADLSSPALAVQNTEWSDPGCFSGMNPVYGNIAQIRDRNAVANFHIAIPHRNDGTRDDVQLLYNTSAQYRQYYSGLGDVSPGIASYLAPVSWPDRLTYPVGTPFLAPATTPVIAYPFPGSPDTRCFNTTIAVPGQCASGSPALLPANYRDARWDTQDVVKLQYQKNIGTSAYVRLFGYSQYSNTNRSGASRRALGSGFGVSNYDYEVDSHKSGVDLQFGDQINAAHQLSGWLQYSAEKLLRINNFNYLNSSSTQTTNLTNGKQCFAASNGTAANGIDAFTAGAPAPCNDPITQGTFRRPTLGQAATCSSAGTPIPAAACAAGASWALTYTGNQAGLNAVRPHAIAASLSDEWKPNDRLDINLGVRFVRDTYDMASTNTPGKNFWFAAAQREYCYNPSTLQPVFVPQPPQSQSKEIPYVSFNCPVDASSGTPVQTVHPDGQNGHLLLSNTYDPTLTQSVFLPRVGLTFTPNRDTVLRFSAGRYWQEPQAYEVQYNSWEENLANQLIGFFPYGFTTPRHDALPQYSNNFDFSYERHFPGTDTSLKLTPYYRWATNQLYTVSVYGQSPALNTGIQRSQGIELQLTKGDFRRNGFAAVFSYTFLDSKEKWANFGGTNRNPVDVFNDYIKQYNALTQAGGGAPCYKRTATAAPDPACGSSSILNPYYTTAPQPLFDRNGWYDAGLDVPYLSPNVFVLVGNYRHDRLAISPSFQLNQGTTYGSPSDVVGIDPRTCRINQAGSGFTTGNPQAADYTSCRVAATPSGNVYTPNPETGHFDRFGEFRQPWQFNLGMQVSYDLSSRVTAKLLVTNLLNRCFGGSSTPWSRAYAPSSNVCGYQSNTFYINNFYNGSSPNDVAANGVPLNPYFAHSFVPSYADPTSFGYANPLNVYVQLRIRL
ncbi:MAG TPA: TonB-dependent receptor [Candidatus Elarobacter sp.]|jgi:hypothetical protein|nr:TonB-dependent receptor [Candidatus Elarobacter sp.]